MSTLACPLACATVGISLADTDLAGLNLVGRGLGFLERTESAHMNREISPTLPDPLPAI